MECSKKYKEDSARQGLLDMFYADRSNRPELTLEEINEEIRAVRRERREREERERQMTQKEA